MATYQSRFPELGFYVKDELRKFTAGSYVTESDAEIAVLDALTDAARVEESIDEVVLDEITDEQPEESADKPAAPKAPAPRKSSAK
ncbi:hypothetical protein [Paenibacillus sp. YIM B09110]|uniref:hypothetical protein n=1 Tax=Paenibacillus sp. YIM B09110 TaxID=3126102 RepID=UPI00301C4B06